VFKLGNVQKDKAGTFHTLPDFTVAVNDFLPKCKTATLCDLSVFDETVMLLQKQIHMKRWISLKEYLYQTTSVTLILEKHGVL